MVSFHNHSTQNYWQQRKIFWPPRIAEKTKLSKNIEKHWATIEIVISCWLINAYYRKVIFFFAFLSVCVFCFVSTAYLPSVAPAQGPRRWSPRWPGGCNPALSPKWFSDERQIRLDPIPRPLLVLSQFQLAKCSLAFARQKSAALQCGQYPPCPILLGTSWLWAFHSYTQMRKHTKTQKFKYTNTQIH